MHYTHLTPEERGQIKAYLEAGYSQRAIGEQLGRSQSAISRELARNQVSPDRPYDPVRAQQRYKEARQECRRPSSLEHPPLRRYVFDKISLGWSPEQVSGRLKLDCPGEPRMRVSHETIYRTIYAKEAFGRALIAHLRQHRKRRRKRGAKKAGRSFIPNRVGIEHRPACANQRARVGDWEADLVLGPHQQGAILTLVDRKTRLLAAAILPSKHASGVAQAALELLTPFARQALHTVTFDNGSEFAQHERLKQTLGADTYFAQPYASWQRGTNENTNGLLRQDVPKNRSLEGLTQTTLNQYVSGLNDRPRKTLGYRTPREALLLEIDALDP